jgi:hypothetical protein
MRPIIEKFCSIFALIVLVTATTTISAADEEEATGESERCINARSIRGADVIDDNYVLFRVQGRRLYLNALPKSCKGLSRDRRFSYETYTRSLCERDMIRVLKEAGGGVYEGRACKLGRFQPITEEELVDFIEDRSVTPKPGAVEAPDLEEVVVPDD